MSGLSEAVVLVSGNTAYVVTDPVGGLNVSGAENNASPNTRVNTSQGGDATHSPDRFGTSALSREDQVRVTSAIRTANRKIKDVRFLTNR